MLNAQSLYNLIKHQSSKKHKLKIALAVKEVKAIENDFYFFTHFL